VKQQRLGADCSMFHVKQETGVYNLVRPSPKGTIPPKSRAPALALSHPGSPLCSHRATEVPQSHSGPATRNSLDYGG